ncbi:MAG: type II toxin-antitoxin system VapC family toxin [Thermodesulfobacteriota bacterium]|nr:type II toxin-antitoxin system VapC family toxin [Thermodesulfobacteriota bacterium]
MAGVKVLDSWALLCYLEQEPGFEKVVELFEKAVQFSKPLLMCMVNWGEVYYQVARRFGEEKAHEIERLIESFPISLVDADKKLTREAARIKSTKPMAYADCFAAALARLQKAELYTGDPEFKAVEKEIKIIWVYPVVA